MARQRPVKKQLINIEMNMKKIITLLLFIPVLSCTQPMKKSPECYQTDVLIYGATPSGILAAVTVKEAGYDAIIVEPSRWVGGILGAGLKPLQDMVNYDAVGGRTRELMLQLGVRTDDDSVTLDKAWQLSLKSMSPKYVRELPEAVGGI